MPAAGPTRPWGGRSCPSPHLGPAAGGNIKAPLDSVGPISCVRTRVAKQAPGGRTPTPMLRAHGLGRECVRKPRGCAPTERHSGVGCQRPPAAHVAITTAGAAGGLSAVPAPVGSQGQHHFAHMRDSSPTLDSSFCSPLLRNGPVAKCLKHYQTIKTYLWVRTVPSMRKPQSSEARWTPGHGRSAGSVPHAAAQSPNASPPWPAPCGL